MLLARQGVALTEQYSFERPDGSAPSICGVPTYRVENGAGTIVSACASMTLLANSRYTWAWTPCASAATDTYYVLAAGSFDSITVADYLLETVQLVAGDPSIVVGATAGLCTRQVVKDAVGITSAESDTRIDYLIDEVTQTFCVEYQREFMQAASTAVRRFVVPKGALFVDLAPYDLRTVCGAVLDPDSDATALTLNTDYALNPPGTDTLTGTYAWLKLAADLDTGTDFLGDFGYNIIAVCGTWGCWADASAVPDDVRRSAVETVLSMLDRPAQTAADYEMIGTPREGIPPVARTWSIPFSAHRRMLRYARPKYGLAGI